MFLRIVVSGKWRKLARAPGNGILILAGKEHSATRHSSAHFLVSVCKSI